MILLDDDIMILKSKCGELLGRLNLNRSNNDVFITARKTGLSFDDNYWFRNFCVDISPDSAKITDLLAIFDSLSNKSKSH